MGDIISPSVTVWTVSYTHLKSTLFNLLLGFITPDKGAIRIDGRPLADVPRQEWHRKVGYVQQEVFVLDGTLAENIALGCRSIDKLSLIHIWRKQQCSYGLPNK